MAEEAKATETKQGGGSANTVLILGVVLIAILAVFMVTSLNKMKTELITLNRQMDTLTTTAAQNAIGTYQAVDEEGNVVMRFQPVPMEMMGDEDLMSCPAGEEHAPH